MAATRLILEIMTEMRETPPEPEEVDRIIAQMVNSFVFNFQDPSQIVSRQMFYLAQGLPADWLEQLRAGDTECGSGSRPERVRRYVHPDRMTILIVGNPDDFDLPPEILGEVRSGKRGGRRCHRTPREARHPAAEKTPLVSLKPAACIIPASSAGSGNSLTDSGRYE